MRRAAIVGIATLLTATGMSAQEVPPPTARQLSRRADSLRVAKDLSGAAALYARAAAAGEFKRSVANSFYAAAYTHALAGSRDSAFKYLDLAFDAGWNNRHHLLTDTDLDSLHKDARWQRAVDRQRDEPPVATDPDSSRLVTTDIANFWNAYDKAERDPANRSAIYTTDYIDVGSVGLQDYFYYKVPSVQSFVEGHDRRKNFYAAIRENTLRIEEQKPAIRRIFAKLKDVYPAARFPDMYFVIGNFSSGGTVSDHGLLLGADMTVRSPDIPLDELTLWEKNNFTSLDRIPPLVAHELIHFQQDSLARDTTLLAAALREGMADFLGELISGRTANPRLHEFAKGRERAIWKEFAGEMYLNRARNWIANSAQETADRPADLGYWVGYVIAKGYYDAAPDKKRAVREILTIRDYRAFLAASGVEKALGS